MTTTTPSKITKFIRALSKGAVFTPITPVSITVCGSEVINYASGVTATSDPISVVVDNPAGLTFA